MKPVWLDPHLELLYERVFVRHKENPNLWNPEILPVPRLFLLFGQKGSGMLDAVNTLNLKHKLTAAIVKLSPVESLSAESMVNVRECSNKVDLLVIEKGHFLLNHSKIYPISLNLKTLTQDFPFILVLSEFWPTRGEHPFWNQFSRDRILLMSTPTKEFHRSLIEYYLLQWQNHWKYSKVVLSSEDYENLAIACSYCTPRNVKMFMRSIFTQIQRVYPSETLDITPELLEKNYHNPTRIPGVWSICEECPDKRQRAYEMGGGFEASSASNAIPAAPKKRKIENSELTIE